jgi:DMSO/TMAO reductase YedYZ heme-binding membrane subunit
MNKRLRNHAWLAAISCVLLWVPSLSGDEGTLADRLSIFSAYLCLYLFTAALLVGPLKVWRSGQPLLNNHLRRDIGIWGGLAGLLHFWLANVLAMTWEYVGIFVENASAPPSAAVRDQLYLWGTILGYVVAVVILVLLTLSSDRMLRRVGKSWWKRLQRLSYVAFIATVAHAFAFQVLESRPSPWIILVAVVTLAVVSLQIIGLLKVRTHRRQHHNEL